MVVYLRSQLRRRDVLRAARPMSDLDSLVSDWRTNGGDQVRQEYLDALAAAS
ncbi:MAG: hypothetical protein JO352_19225 [Chloroflexi bacterium]|nr:hypothetical protein [Chloroflexota bacterium]MBV9598806.1 hypothetical protein [Chloroflexota bacterium]